MLKTLLFSGLLSVSIFFLLSDPAVARDCRVVMRGNSANNIYTYVKCDGLDEYEQTTPTKLAAEVRLGPGIKVFGKIGHGVGVLLLHDKSINLVDSIFEDLPPDIESGPVLAPVVLDNATTTITNVTITKQRTGQISGGIYVTGGSRVTLENSLMEDNVGAGAGALAVADKSWTGVKNCTFKKNSAPGWAGSVHIYGTSTLEVSDSLFDGTQSPPSVSDVSELRLMLVGQFRVTEIPSEANLLPVAGAIHSSDGSSVSVKRTNFVGYTAQQGTLHSTGKGHVELFLTNFTDNFVREGAAVFLEDSDATINTCIFRGNMATVGGALGLKGSGSVTTKYCDFLQNTALSNGGALYINSSSDNVCIEDGATVVLHNSTFYGNEAKGNGGALYAVCPGAVSVIDSWFEDNTAGTAGGGLCVLNSSAVAVGNSHMMRNKADAGGAIWAFDAKTASIASVSCISNIARKGSGAGALIVRTPEVNVEGSSFLFNLAEEKGAGIAVLEGQSLSVKHTELHFNQADRNGGGLFVSRVDTLEVDNVTINENVAAGHGGGVEGYDVTFAKFTATEFYSNKAQEEGGALSLQSWGNGVSFSAEGCLFTKNFAQVGGAVRFKHAQSVAFRNLTCSSNVAEKEGGCIAAIGSSLVTVHKANFTANSVGTGPTGSGGAIHHNGDVLELDDVLVNSNSAGLQGGAIMSFNASNVKLSNCSVRENNVQGTGGALGLVGAGVVEISQTVFTENSAGSVDEDGTQTPGEGGALHSIEGGSMEIKGCLFQNNHARGGGDSAGGAVCILRPAKGATIELVNFINNTCEGSGGAVSLKDVPVSNIRSSSFNGSRADIGGGLVLEGLSQLIGSDLSFSNNVANTFGGVLRCSGNSTVSVHNSTFYRDTAKYGDGLVAYCNCTMNISSSMMTEEEPLYATHSEGNGTCATSVETPQTVFWFSQSLADVKTVEKQKVKDVGMTPYFGQNLSLVKILSDDSVAPENTKTASIRTAIVVSVSVIALVALVGLCFGIVAFGKWIVSAPEYDEHKEAEAEEKQHSEVFPEDSASPSAPLLQNVVTSPRVHFEGNSPSISVDKEPVDPSPENFGQSTEDYGRAADVRPVYTPEPVIRSSEAPVPPLSPVPPLFGPGLKDSEIQEV